MVGTPRFNDLTTSRTPDSVNPIYGCEADIPALERREEYEFSAVAILRKNQMGVDGRNTGVDDPAIPSKTDSASPVAGILTALLPDR